MSKSGRQMIFLLHWVMTFKLTVCVGSIFLFLINYFFLNWWYPCYASVTLYQTTSVSIATAWSTHGPRVHKLSRLRGDVRPCQHIGRWRCTWSSTWLEQRRVFPKNPWSQNRARLSVAKPLRRRGGLSQRTWPSAVPCCQRHTQEGRHKRGATRW